MSLNALALSPTRQNLWRLIVIRLLVLLAQAVSVIGAWYSGLFALEWLPLLLTLGLSAVVSLLSLLRLLLSLRRLRRLLSLLSLLSALAISRS